VAVDITVGVVGLKESLKELNKIAPTLRRQITKDYIQIMQPVTNTVQKIIPTIPPVSGMSKGWKTKSGAEMLPASGWNGNKAQKLLKPKINTRKVKEFQGQTENVGTFGVVLKGNVNTIFDMAGRKSRGNTDVFSRVGSHGRRVGTVGGPQLIAMLQGRYGGASRAVWAGYERSKNEVDREMEKLVQRVMDLVNGDLPK
jgi:hypothetical protein